MTIQELYLRFKECSTVTTDTRNISENSMFFALKGPNFNANEFAAEALKKESRYAIIDEKEFLIDERTILVDNVLKTLQDLSKYHREQLSIPVIGITGSNGKTTSKELMFAVLSKKYKVAATKGNLNNHIGVPLTILSIDQDIEIAIVEMGANHAGEIAFLCTLSQPNYGLITNIGMAHLEGFGSLETIIETKTALYKFLARSGGKAFVNEQDERLVGLSNKNDRVLFRNKKNINAQAIPSTSPFLSFDLTDEGEIYKGIETQLVGDYNLDNILAALAIAKYFDVKMEDSIAAIKDYRPANNRSQWMNSGKNQLILDAYNANPSSTYSAIRNFETLLADNKIIILGDMLELGKIEKEEHQRIIDLLNENKIQTLLVGPIYNSCTIGPSMKQFSSTEDAKAYLLSSPLENKTILIKGSRGLKLESLVDAL